MSVKMAILNLCQVWEVLKQYNYKLYAYISEGCFLLAQSLCVRREEVLLARIPQAASPGFGSTLSR